MQQDPNDHPRTVTGILAYLLCLIGIILLGGSLPS
jgi:hypothetical protein